VAPPENPPGYVVIDLKTIYDQILILNTRVELIMSKQLEHDRDSADHENRLRTLEKARWPLPAAALLLSLVSAGIALLPKLT
jgi:hypothetical protein